MIRGDIPAWNGHEARDAEGRHARRPAGRRLARPDALHRRLVPRADPAGRARRLAAHAPHLAALAESLEHGAVPSTRFHEHDAHSPLPRAYQWADGSAYVNHVELVRKARGAEMPASFWTDPLMYQGGSDAFLGAARSDRAWPTRPGASTWRARSRSSSTTCRWAPAPTRRATRSAWSCWSTTSSLRDLIPAELAKGFGFFQSKPSSAFSPVAVTPDELGDAWDGGKLHLPLLVDLNGKPFGRANAGVDMTFDFPTLIAHAAKTRPLAAGTIIGSGTVSNKLDGGPGKPVADGGAGYSCIAEMRMIETIETARRRRRSCASATRCASR